MYLLFQYSARESSAFGSSVILLSQDEHDFVMKELSKEIRKFDASADAILKRNAVPTVGRLDISRSNLPALNKPTLLELISSTFMLRSYYGEIDDKHGGSPKLTPGVLASGQK